MPGPRFRRRKEDRPREIAEAAFATFAEKGYAATRVEEVAQRAGVSKGLLYLYYRTKEELFKAVIRSLVKPRIDTLTATIDVSGLTAEQFLRGPFLDFARQLPGSPVAVVIRLMIAEGPKHPDLVQYYWENVVSRGLAAIKRLLERGVANGEFLPSRACELPQLVIMPVVFSVVFRLLFDKQPLDTDALMETHIDMLIAYLKGASHAA